MTHVSAGRRAGDRPEEIAFLIELILEKSLTAGTEPDPKPAPTFIERCLSQEWPGNVRSLARVVARAVTSVPKKDGTFDIETEAIAGIVGDLASLRPEANVAASPSAMRAAAPAPPRRCVPSRRTCATTPSTRQQRAASSIGRTGLLALNR